MAGTGWDGKTLGFIGGGNMAEALVRGVLAADLMPADMITVYDPLLVRRQIFSAFGCVATDNPAAPPCKNVVLLAVKPQTISLALAEAAKAVTPDTLVISIAAGVRIDTIERALPAGTGVVRVMPNTPLLIGKGVSALAAGSRADAADMDRAMELFSCAGRAYRVDEKDLDAVTALSGSGPAYLFAFAEALIAAGVAAGLSPALASDLAVGTLEGSAGMLSQLGDPAALRERVTSPGGTTAAALAVFRERRFAETIGEAVLAAKNRSTELGREQ